MYTRPYMKSKLILRLWLVFTKISYKKYQPAKITLLAGIFGNSNNHIIHLKSSLVFAYHKKLATLPIKGFVNFFGKLALFFSVS